MKKTPFWLWKPDESSQFQIFNFFFFLVAWTDHKVSVAASWRFRNRVSHCSDRFWICGWLCWCVLTIIYHHPGIFIPPYNRVHLQWGIPLCVPPQISVDHVSSAPALTEWSKKRWVYTLCIKCWNGNATELISCEYVFPDECSLKNPEGHVKWCDFKKLLWSVFYGS